MVPRNPLPPSAHIIEATWQEGRWIIGSENGTISHSENGRDWSTVALPYVKGIETVFFWKGVYYAVGVDSRFLARSADLVHWEELDPPDFPFNPKEFLPVGERLFVVGYTPGLAYTEDGVTWTRVDITDFDRLEGLAGNGEILVVVGGDGLIYSSEDGLSWTLRQEGIAGLEGIDDDFLFVRWIGDQFLAGGKNGLLMRSSDGLTWQLVDTPDTSWFFTVVWFAGAWFFPGSNNGEVLRTTDLATWEVVDTGLGSPIRVLAAHGDQLLVGGRNGVVGLSDLEGEWTPVDTGTSEFFFEIEYGADVFVAGDAAGQLWKSTDSEGWVPVHQISAGSAIAGLVFDGSQFIALSAAGNLATSPDGDAWAEADGPGGHPNQMRQLDGSYWLVGRDGQVASSDNLADWDSRVAGEEDLQDIAFGNGSLVAVGRNASVFHSTNGADWTFRETGVSGDLHAVAFFQGSFYALGRPNILLASTDGLVWESLGSNQTPFDGRRLEVIGDELVALGYFGQCHTSTDGREWMLRPARIFQYLYDILHAEERTVAVGGFGTILSTPFVLTGGYAEWAGLRFTALQLADPEVSGPGADPDRDDRSNAFEFFSNTPPLVPNAGPPFERFLLEEAGQRYPAFRIVQRTRIAGAELQFWETANLAEWRLLEESALELLETTPLDTETERRTYRTADPAGTDPALFHVLGIGLD